MLRRLYEMLAWAGVVCAATPGLSLAGEEAAPPRGTPKPAAKAEVDDEGEEAPTPDHEALELLAEARAAYKAGDLEHAREMAERVGEIEDVSASVLGDARLILTQISTKAAANAASEDEESADESTVAEMADDEAPLEDEALASGDEPSAATGEDPADGESAPSFGEGSDSPTTLTADELYRQGKEALRAGDKDEAYSLYLRAYRSGQPLSGRQKTEIREFLST